MTLKCLKICKFGVLRKMASNRFAVFFFPKEIQYNTPHLLGFKSMPGRNSQGLQREQTLGDLSLVSALTKVVLAKV